MEEDKASPSSFQQQQQRQQQKNTPLHILNVIHLTKQHTYKM